MTPGLSWSTRAKLLRISRAASNWLKRTRRMPDVVVGDRLQAAGCSARPSRRPFCRSERACSWLRSWNSHMPLKAQAARGLRLLGDAPGGTPRAPRRSGRGRRAPCRARSGPPTSRGRRRRAFWYRSRASSSLLRVVRRLRALRRAPSNSAGRRGRAPSRAARRRPRRRARRGRLRSARPGPWQAGRRSAPASDRGQQSSARRSAAHGRASPGAAPRASPPISFSLRSAFSCSTIARSRSPSSLRPEPVVDGGEQHVPALELRGRARRAAPASSGPPPGRSRPSWMRAMP